MELHGRLAGEPRFLEVHGAIREGVRFFVLFATDVLDLRGFETAAKRRGPAPQNEHVGMLDLVEAVHLLHHEFGIRADLEPSRPPRGREFEGVNEGSIFGHIVRCVSDETEVLGHDLAPGIDGVHTEARGPGVPPRTAVDVDDEFGRRRGTQGSDFQPGRGASIAPWGGGTLKNMIREHEEQVMMASFRFTST